MSPETLCSVALPSRTDSMRTSPETDFVVTDPPTRDALTSPDTVCTWTSPCTRPWSRTSPLTVLTVASPKISAATVRSPDAVFDSSADSCPETCASADAELSSARLEWGTRACTRSFSSPKRQPAMSIVIPNPFWP
jgi:hypothetical protein